MYVGSNDKSFFAYLKRKYKKDFDSIDDYLIWLFRFSAHSNKFKYYQLLEEEIICYSNEQTGKEE